MVPSMPPQSGRSVAVGVFAHAAQARRAADALTARGANKRELSLFEPELPTSADIDTVLGNRGVPEGERRFYTEELRSGRALLVIDARDDYADLRELLMRHGGYDVQSRGGDIARPEGSGLPGGTGPAPADVTSRWQDVSSRYEMLWQQHYGTTDTTWDRMEPIYRFAWDVANQPRLRGRPWSEAEPSVRRAWQGSHDAAAWDNVAGPIRDVWEDVAAEAGSIAEGGRARNIVKPSE